MTRRKNGRRPLLTFLLLLPWLLAGSVEAGAPAPAAAQSRQSVYGVILGTVFRDTGHACAGAEVVLEADPEAPLPGKKPKRQKLAASARGEVVFRVPPGPMRYTLSVKAKGYKPQSKTVNIQGDERLDVNFLLEVETR